MMHTNSVKTKCIPLEPHRKHGDQSSVSEEAVKSSQVASSNSKVVEESKAKWYYENSTHIYTNS